MQETLQGHKAYKEYKEQLVLMEQMVLMVPTGQIAQFKVPQEQTGLKDLQVLMEYKEYKVLQEQTEQTEQTVFNFQTYPLQLAL